MLLEHHGVSCSIGLFRETTTLAIGYLDVVFVILYIGDRLCATRANSRAKARVKERCHDTATRSSEVSFQTDLATAYDLKT
jgi:hypothetical protein